MNQSESCGKVYLVGAGPGDPGLLTLKAKVLLENADVVLYDALVSPSILAMINPRAEQIHAGKRRGRHSLVQEEITALLIEKARLMPWLFVSRGVIPLFSVAGVKKCLI